MLRNYVLTAWAVFMRRKAFTLINLLCIVLTLTVLLVITALLEFAFWPSGVEGKSDRFLQVAMLTAASPDGQSINRSPLGYKLIEKYIKPVRSAELVSAVTSPEQVAVYQDGAVAQLYMRLTDAAYWKILDFTVLDGRVLSADDVDSGRMVAVVNASTAARLFPGGRAVGQKIDIGGRAYTIVGVVADAMHLNAFSDIWTPLTTAPSSDYRQQLFGSFTALLLAKSPADLPAIRREVVQASSRVEFDDPAKWKRALFRADSKLDAFARLTIGGDNPADGEMTVDEGSSGAAIMLSAIAVLMLLFMLLPALNMVNLNVGRIMERSGEIGVRKAFGATSATLIGQLVVENVLLCLAGGVLALGCAQGVLWWLERSALIPYLDVDVNLAVFGWSLAIATVFGLLSGVLPAWRMARLDPVSALKGNA